jgi:hypothetical protein
MKVWLGKAFSPGYRQLMCCALKSTTKGKGERRLRRSEKEYYNKQNYHAVIRGVFIPPIQLKNFSQMEANRIKWG